MKRFIAFAAAVALVSLAFMAAGIGASMIVSHERETSYWTESPSPEVLSLWPAVEAKLLQSRDGPSTDKIILKRASDVVLFDGAKVFKAEYRRESSNLREGGATADLPLIVCLKDDGQILFYAGNDPRMPFAPLFSE